MRPVVRVFRDRNAAAAPDWPEHHRQYIEGAHCMIYIATPGAMVPAGSGQDWVDRELASWIQHQRRPPFIVNPYGTAGLRFIPARIRRLWPDPNCIDYPSVYCRDDEAFRRRREEVESAVQRLLDSIAEAEGAILNDTAARRLAEIRRLRALQHRTRWALVVTGAMAVVFFGAMVLAGEDRDQLAAGNFELTEELTASAGQVVMLKRLLRNEERKRRAADQELDDSERTVAELQASVTRLQARERKLTGDLDTVKGPLAATEGSLASERSAKEAAELAAAKLQKQLDEHQCPQPPPSGQGQAPGSQDGAASVSGPSALPEPTAPSSAATIGDTDVTLATGS